MPESDGEWESDTDEDMMNDVGDQDGQVSDSESPMRRLWPGGTPTSCAHNVPWNTPSASLCVRLLPSLLSRKSRVTVNTCTAKRRADTGIAPAEGKLGLGSVRADTTSTVPAWQVLETTIKQNPTGTIIVCNLDLINDEQSYRFLASTATGATVLRITHHPDRVARALRRNRTLGQELYRVRRAAIRAALPRNVRRNLPVALHHKEHLGIPRELSLLRECSNLPVVFSLKSVSDGGNMPDDEVATTLFMLAFKMGVEYVEVNLSATYIRQDVRLFGAKGNTKIIATSFWEPAPGSYSPDDFLRGQDDARGYCKAHSHDGRDIDQEILDAATR
ncbi:hypothetical protein QFC20_006446 [Naganishia adeliensis]|uniref:Uncharacterized protein n=1 Tax=Naganishia adeliensis TaxID=92952 RepID=A0ACC2VAC3_9TREE|nr:hypothetical protein QFC20_006446 [Naganishia adeliensis]